MSSASDRRRLYNTIPDDTDVLITHGPPYGILDIAPSSTLHAGCHDLFDAVTRVRPSRAVFTAKVNTCLRTRLPTSRTFSYRSRERLFRCWPSTPEHGENRSNTKSWSSMSSNSKGVICKPL